MDFSREIKRRVNAYFEIKGISKNSDILAKIKIGLIILSFVAVYFTLLSGKFSATVMLALAALFGLLSVLIAMNIGHDAVHNALFRNPKWNRFCSYSWELVGMSSYMWRINHNIIHHPYPNVSPIDVELNQSMPYIRFSQYFKKYGFHKYQHIYGPFLYLLFATNLTLIRDLQDFGILKREQSQRVVKNIPFKHYMFLVASKLFYLGYALFVPMAVINIVWWKILLGFFAVQAVMSLGELSIQLPLHVNDTTKIVPVDDQGKIDTSRILQIFNSTTDFMPQSRLANIFFGGINTHVIHHLFPGVCHAHYVELTMIMRDTAAEFGIPYKTVSWGEGLKSHFRKLKELGRA